MRAARTLAVAATAFAAVGLAAPLAAATNGPGDVTVNSSVVQRGGDGNQGVTVTPFAVHQGSTLTITVRGCSGGRVTSDAFPTTSLSANVNGVSSAVARIHDNARLGQHTLTVHCNNNRVLTGQFRVLAGQGSQGGIGGSLAPSSTEMAVGGSLVAAAGLGGGLFIARRRRVGAAA
ncbi:hypothetical protein [Streptomyces sp. NPDC008121]|uniref:hypothetical protein n=1 Tax=Streptomyces sp. NPDC008121 TaxID=3364809 RepID=UPI0036E92B73